MDVIDELIADAVRAELARRRVTIKQAAAYLGLSPKTLGARLNFYGGTFSGAELVALAELLNVEPSAFLPRRRPAA